MYPDEITIPCRQELQAMGVTELMNADDVTKVMDDHSGTAIVFVNSVCGCAAGSARPALRMALNHETRPDNVYSVFAGVDADATNKAREYMEGVPPSSPAIALFKNGELVYMIERYMIEGRYPDQIADALKAAFDDYCK